jgi:tetraacyldisaccharide 4'-kinase
LRGKVAGIEQLKINHGLVILLDDAFQHRAVKPGLSILLFDYNRLTAAKICTARRQPARAFQRALAGRHYGSKQMP